jgi:hypothetical protein
MTIQREPGESKDIPKKVILSVVHDYVVTNSLEPMFQQFPFDSHSLALKFHARSHEVRLNYIPGTIVPEAQLADWQTTGWAPDLGKGQWVRLAETVPEVSFDLEIHVRRDFGIHIWRLLVPSCLLVVISWSAFWISPRALMPRFASGFISFLAMQGFKTYAASLMPKNGKIGSTSWIDIYISVCSILMTVSVLETVSVQYINEAISHWACRNVDIAARWAFPLVFGVLLVFMFLITDIDILLVVAHVIVALYIVVFFSYAIIQGYAFPVIIVKRGLSDRTPGRGRGSDWHIEWEFDANEMKAIFDRLGHISRDVEEGGHANSDCFCKWLIKWKPALKPHSEDLRQLTHDYFGEQFQYPLFKERFASYLTAVQRLLHGIKPRKGDIDELARTNPALRFNASDSDGLSKVTNGSGTVSLRTASKADCQTETSV